MNELKRLHNNKLKNLFQRSVLTKDRKNKIDIGETCLVETRIVDKKKVIGEDPAKRRSLGRLQLKWKI